MKRETLIAAVALAIAPFLLVAQGATQAHEGALARASFIEAPKDSVPRAVPAEGQAPKQEQPAEAKPADQPATQAPEPKAEPPAEGTSPAAEQPPTGGQAPAAQPAAVPADPKQAAEQAAEKQRAANEADAATEEAATAVKAPKRFIPTQKSQADSSATFPIDI